MNRRMVSYTVARIIRIEAILLLLPAFAALIYGEFKTAAVYAGVSLGTILFGTFIKHISKPRSKVIYAKEGFVIVSAAWVLLSAIGALPFVLSGAIPSYVDAFFETVSGFTTTGSSILTNVEAMDHGNLFWRSFTHWVGGMGFLVFVIAVTNNISDRSIHILRAEVPGPVVGKLVPKATQTAKILYLIYLAMTVTEVIMLCAGGMPLFDSLLHSFGTAGTGGFGIKNDGLASYSPYCQWVIAVFMLLFGINFNIYYLLLIRRFRSVLKSTEMWAYLIIILLSTSVIAVNINSITPTVGKSIRDAFFQVSSIITTTGFATTNFDTWPNLSKSVLFFLMFIGACAGSTGGGLKVSRFVILLKVMKRQLKKMIHPRLVKSIQMEGKAADEEMITGVTAYFGVYMIVLLVAFFLISFEPLGGAGEEPWGVMSNLSAVVSCFNNIGPAFEKFGPASNFSYFTDFSKLVLSAAMLLGRLEIYPILICFSPSTWSKK